MKRLLSIILSVALIICMVPATAMADSSVGGLTYSIFDAKIPFKNIVDCQRTTSTTVGALQQVDEFSYVYGSIGDEQINELVADVEANPGNYYYKFIDEAATDTIGLNLYKYNDSSYEYAVSTDGEIQSYGDHCFIYVADGWGSFVSFRDKAYHICRTADCHKTNFEWTGDPLDPYRSDCILCGCGEAFVIQGSYPDNDTLKALGKDEDDQLVQFENLGDILIAEDFGLWGDAHPGWYNVGWRYAEGFDYSTITAIEVGIQDANGTDILTYTANAEQVAWQQDTAGNGGYIYINQNRQSSAPFGKTVPAGSQEDWTVAHGPAFEGFTAEKAYVTVWVGDQSKTVNYTCSHAHSWAADFTVDKAATTSAAGEKSKHCTDANCVARTEITPIEQLTPAPTPTPTPPSGGGYVSIERPDVTADDGGSYELSFLGTTLKIAAKDGYELADVTVNGVSKGAVTELKGLKTGDKVVITTKAIVDEPAVEPEPEAPAADVQLVARSKMSKADGQKAVKVYWYAEDGSDLNYDGYEVFRSVKRYEGYGKKPFFTTEREVYWNTDIEDGQKYYYRVRGYNVVDGEKDYSEWSLKAWRTVE